MESKFFVEKEFECKCGKCSMGPISKELVKVLDDVREHFGKPVIITSGWRCENHNRDVGGAAKSMHTQGIAADFIVKGINPEVVCDYLDGKYPDEYGIGEYSGWTHLDVRAYKARW